MDLNPWPSIPLWRDKIKYFIIQIPTSINQSIIESMICEEEEEFMHKKVHYTNESFDQNFLEKNKFCFCKPFPIQLRNTQLFIVDCKSIILRHYKSGATQRGA